MGENFPAYRKRVLEYLGDRSPVHVLQKTPSRVEKMLKEVPRGGMKRRPNKNSWSIAEVVAHMADAELAFGWRIRNILASSGCELAWFDEHAWGENLGYREADPKLMLVLFRKLRESNLALLRAAGSRKMRIKFGIHQKRGKQTVYDFVRMEAAHDLAHIRQIRILLSTHKKR